MAVACAAAAWTAAAAPPAPPPVPSSPGGAAPALLRVVRGGKWGFVDASGAVVIAPRFDRAGEFSEGLAPVQEGKVQGYVDAAGAVVLVPGFTPAGPVHRRFSDGLAVVRVGTEYAYIDRSGRLAFDRRFGRAEDFSGGFAVACDPATGCGYVDRTGAGVVGPGLWGGHPARGGMACAILQVMMGRERVRLHRVPGGKALGEYEGCGNLSEGLVAVRSGDLWGYLDAEGKGAIAPAFAWAGDFSEGLAPARDASGRCGYIGRDGAFAIAPRFRACAPFSSGRARVDLAVERWDAARVAFVDRAGAPVVVGTDADPPFDTAQDFERGAAAVGVGGEPRFAGPGGPRLGYLDPAGRWIWPPQN